MPHDGRSAVALPGFSYHPRFITVEESAELIDYFGSIRPIWEQRHQAGAHPRSGKHNRRLTRPVYWLGAWQFACLGYYAEPDHREDRCVTAEPFPPVMRRILKRLEPILREHDATRGMPNSCLINYYGREIKDGPPRDYARLRMHRDGEPGPVVMFSIGQPGLLEFLDPNRDSTIETSVWTRHRSVNVISGDFKDRLYHRITEVRHGQEPRLTCRVSDFEARRISVSFRHVPPELIRDYSSLSLERQRAVRELVAQLAQGSEHFRRQLDGRHQP